MLHTLVVISAYMSMVFIPCACAQWGDVLTAEWRDMRRELRRELRARRSGMSEALLTAIREAREAARLEALAKYAFITDPLLIPRLVGRVHKLHRGRPLRRHVATNMEAFNRLVARVTTRLCVLSESFRLAHEAAIAPTLEWRAFYTPSFAHSAALLPETKALPAPQASSRQMHPAQQLEPASEPSTPVLLSDDEKLNQQIAARIAAIRKPPMRALPEPEVISALLHFPPTAEELEALYALGDPVPDMTTASGEDSVAA